MTTYYLQNQMIAKLSEQSTMEEQINLSPQKKYTASGTSYMQEVISLASGAPTSGSAFIDRLSNYDYVLLENVGTTSVVFDTKRKIGTATSVEISATETPGAIDISGSGSFAHTNYGYSITLPAASQNALVTFLSPYEYATGSENAMGPYLEFTDSSSNKKGPFFIVRAGVTGGDYKMDLISNQNTTLPAATGYTVDVIFQTSQLILAGESVVIPGVSKTISNIATFTYYSFGLCSSPADMSAGTFPGGQLKVTAVGA